MFYCWAALPLTNFCFSYFRFTLCFSQSLNFSHLPPHISYCCRTLIVFMTTPRTVLPLYVSSSSNSPRRDWNTPFIIFFTWKRERGKEIQFTNMWSTGFKNRYFSRQKTNKCKQTHVVSNNPLLFKSGIPAAKQNASCHLIQNHYLHSKPIPPKRRQVVQTQGRHFSLTTSTYYFKFST